MVSSQWNGSNFLSSHCVHALLYDEVDVSFLTSLLSLWEKHGQSPAFYPAKASHYDFP
jgi:hypothetical protein